jgi:hypothetical protein
MTFMNAELKLSRMLSQVENLNKDEHVSLLKKIASMIIDNDLPPGPIKLSDVSGLGSSLWHDVNIDQYIEHERQR